MKGFIEALAYLIYITLGFCGLLALLMAIF